MQGIKGFQKGVVTNSTGRKKGSSNVVTGRIRSLWEDMMVENIDQLKEDFQTLKPKERLELAIKMSGFIVPRLQSIEVRDFPEWGELVLMDAEERTKEIIRLKNEMKNESKTEN